MSGFKAILGAAGMVCGLAVGASAEALNSGGGHKFLSAGKKSDQFEKAPVLEAGACNFMSPSMKFCEDDTGWKLEGSLIYNERALYRLNETYAGAVSVIPLRTEQIAALTADDLDALLEEKVLMNGPRGQRRLDSLLGIQRDPTGKPHAATALIVDENGDRMMLQVNIFVLNEGVGFFETTALLGTEPSGFKATDQQRIVHAEFLNAGRFVTNQGSTVNE